MESYQHEFSVFATLTYDAKALGFEPVDLVPRDMQLFLKRLRMRYFPKKIRFYGVGEYGGKSWRPHYHLALFGASMSDHTYDLKTGWINGGPVFDAWKNDDGIPLGGAHLGELNETTAHYVAGYVTKKMTAPDDPRLEGRPPEFARMSLRPGIGRGAIGSMAANFGSRSGAAALAAELESGTGDVPHEVRINGKKYPLGRYLRKALREEVGFGSETPDHVLYDAAVRSAYMTVDELRQLEKKREAAALTAEARDKLAKGSRSI